MASCILIGVFIGIGLDRLTGSSPAFLIVFSLIGAVAAFKVMFDLTMKGEKKKS